jgi:hypothetical protein
VAVRSTFGRIAVLLVLRPWLLTLTLCMPVILLDLRGPDLPAQEFRAWIARSTGLAAFNNQWYDGHSLLGYSVIFPPVGAVLGVRTTGVFACLAVTWTISKLMPGSAGPAQAFFGLVVSAAVVGELIIGQVPFALGLAFGLAALLAVRHRHPGSALVLAVCCGLSSPLAGFFLLLAELAWAPELGWRRAAPLGTAGLGLLVAYATGGGGGRFPYPLWNLLGDGLIVVAALVLVPCADRVIRRFVVLYGAACAVFYLVPNPVGGNIDRLALILVLPTAGFVLLRQGRRLELAGLALPLLAWQLTPVATALADSAGDPSLHASYYAGLEAFLATQPVGRGRLEVPFTREHWETVFLAQRFPLARGWERQLDLEYSPVLYRPLTAAGYRAWLDANAVRLVALPDVPLDSGGRAEATLLNHPPSYLHLLWADAHWKVWEVSNATPLVSGDATLAKFTLSSLALTFQSAGTATVRIHADASWGLGGDSPACLATTPDGWLEVTARRPATVDLYATVRNLFDRDTCRSATNTEKKTA